MIRYDYDFDVNADSVAGRVVRLVGRDQRVLELGCSSGHMSRVLKSRGCSVVGIEIDPVAAQNAREWCDVVYVANLDDPDWCDALNDAPLFDVIVAADVLEHLRDPQRCLAQLRRLLKSGGRIVLSTPNIAYGGVVAGLLQGEFNYRATGLLDSTHVHFFTAQSLRQVLESEGFSLEHLSPVEAETDHPEFAAQWQSLPVALRNEIENIPNGKVFQWVACAAKEPDQAHQLVLQEAQRQIEILRHEQEEHQSLKGKYQDLYQQELDLRQRYEELLREKEQKLGEKVRQCEVRLQSERLKLDAQIRLAAVLQSRAEQLEDEVQAILHSSSWRITAPFRVMMRIARAFIPSKNTVRRLPIRVMTWLYWHLIPAAVRIQVKDALFREFPLVFRNTVQYREWQSWQQQSTDTSLEMQEACQAITACLEDSNHVYEPQIYAQPMAPGDLRLIAFYLPQFHPVPENDEWWGKGFTEWTNVSKAKPQFEGHYQPHLPGELGFYDLRVPEVMQRQVELAKIAGLAGFCFHFYWFAGRRLLEKPLDMYLASPELDLPFCICWANETWSRRWDGSEADVLIEQVHTPETDAAFIRDVAPILTDPRYIRVDGKPVLIVYRASLLPDAKATAALWRKYFAEHGLGELYLVAALSFDIHDPRPFGFDAAVEFPPHGMVLEPVNEEVSLLNPGYAGRVYDYKEMAADFSARKPDGFVLHKTVVPSWDNEARKPGRGASFIHTSPDDYADWLKSVCQQTVQNNLPSQRLVFVNAWNEWAEGAHLEPDRRYGYAWLNRTREVLSPYTSPVPVENTALVSAVRHNKVAVIFHMHYPELFAEVASYLVPIANRIDLYVSVREGTLDYCRKMILNVFPGAIIVTYPNHGRDVLPFLNIYRHIMGLGYSAVCKLHSKKSRHRQDGALWRHDVYDKLIGSVERIDQCINALDGKIVVNGEVANIPGVIGPAGHVLDGSNYWSLNKIRTTQLAREMECPDLWLDNFHFVAGTMFWFRPEALLPLMQLELNETMFEPEAGQVDGTLAHALERLIGLSCRKSGFQLCAVDNGGVMPVGEVGDYPFAVKT